MGKGKVLFIDDDNFLRKVYETELSEKGFEVQLAADGQEGLQKIADTHPDIVILDLIMPNKNGFEVLSDLQRFEETRALPVIVLSNLGQSEDQKRALDLGAVEYLIKDNTTLDIIAEKIDFHLHSRSAKERSTQAVLGQSGGLAKELEQRKQKADQTTAVTEGSRSAPATQQERALRGKNFCTNCGFKLAKNAKFCPDCGAQQ
jgi:DNA-binding response OmpR family regulator